MVFEEVICYVGNLGFARSYVTTSHIFSKSRYFLILRNEIPKSLKAGMPRHKLQVFAHLPVFTTHIAFCEPVSLQSLFCSLTAGSIRQEGTWMPGSVMFSIKVIFSLNFSLHHWAPLKVLPFRELLPLLISWINFKYADHVLYSPI